MNDAHTTSSLPEVASRSESTPVVSSALNARPTVGAFEIKFVVDLEKAERIREAAKSYLSIDPHAESEIGDGYRVSSLYFDTSELDVLHRNGIWQRSKFRLRRYGSSPIVFAERKTKRRGLVTKRRCELQDEELELLGKQDCQEAWHGAWYHQRLQARKLGPKMRICYDRMALTDVNAFGPVRFTMDRNLFCMPCEQYALSVLERAKPILEGQAIIEMKFRETMPAYFRTLMETFALSPTSMSKYRTSMLTCGLDQQRKAG
jgi:hypothetical protein